MEIPSMTNGLGVCPPGYYTADSGAILPSSTPATAPQAFNPYATESTLSGRGLRGSSPRWDLLLLGFGVAFAGMLGYSLLKR